MASAVLHIKDGYFFEVPKFLWRRHYASLEEVPEFLRKAHPDATLAEFKSELSGKILIPQPFGTLKNLHDAESGFCISKFMIIETIVAILLVYMFKKYGEHIKSGDAPRGKFWNAIDALVLYVRNDIARSAIGDHDADDFAPYLWTVFFFILTCNLCGMLPWVGAPTAAFGATLALALMTFVTVVIGGSKKHGVVGFWTNQVPHLGLPWYYFPLVAMIFVIEVIGLFIKHGVLAIRLLANMVAGHLVILGIMGIIASAAAASTGIWGTATTLSVSGSVLFNVLELFVAFLQAYVFTFLSALFISAAVHHH